MFNIGETIEYLVDVSSPLNQKGTRGQTKIIDRDIPLWTANYLLRGGMVRLYDPASPLQLEEEKTKKSKDIPAKVSGSNIVAGTGTKVKKERRTNGQREILSETDQASVNESENTDSKRGARNRRG